MTVTADSPGTSTLVSGEQVNGIDRGILGRSPVRSKRKSLVRRIFSESGLVLVFSLALYLAVGALLDFHYDAYALDAISRLANGFYVLYSRDPHLAAVGFVWNPLPSFADLVPLLFYHLWPPLASHIFAATLVSAVTMAGMVYQVWWALYEWGVSRAPRLIIVAFLGLNGMIVYYGANGMSEGIYLFTLVATCRYLLRWIRQDDLPSLVYAAVALGWCYLARNEAAFAAVLSGAVVVIVGYVRQWQSNSSPRSRRVWGALTDAAIFEIPFVVAFVGWAVISYVITGQAFQRISVAVAPTAAASAGGPLPPLDARIHGDLLGVIYMAPLILPVLLLAFFVAFRRRDLGILAPLSVLGGGLLFSLVSYAGGLSPGYFRYFIVSVPLEIFLVGSLFATATAPIGAIPRPAWSSGRRLSQRRALGALAAVLAFALLAPSAVMTVRGMFNTKIGPEEADTIGFIFHKHLSLTDLSAKHQLRPITAITSYLADMHLSDGQVVVDNQSNCIPFVIVASSNPKMFVIPNDRDYQRILADPLTFNVHYLLEEDPGGNNGNAGSRFAVSYPALWTSGAGFAKKVHYFPAASGCPAAKLFRVTGHPG
jgi:hypothetical protein